MYKKRIKIVREEFKNKKIDGFIVSDLGNVEYLTGFSGSFGYVLILKKTEYLFTDKRYHGRVKKEAGSIKIKYVKEKFFSEIMPILKKYKVKSLGLESSAVTYDEWKSWKKNIKKIRLVPVKQLVERKREIKDKGEIRAICRAIKITEHSLTKVIRKIKRGVTEKQIALEIDNSMRKGSDAQPSFSTIVAFGENSAVPHAKPTVSKLNSNSIILIDIGTYTSNYSSDLTRTLCMGRITRAFRDVYSTVLEAQKRAIEGVRPGRKIADIDRAARDHIKAKGYGRYFTHGLGHGIGRSVHELPVISFNNKGVLKEGMIFTIEPGIYIPGWGGVRIEDIVLVTKAGVKVLTSFPKELNETVIK